MSVSEICDIAYAAIYDQWFSQTLVDRQIAGAMMAAGAKDVELPDPGKVKEELDKSLNDTEKEKTRSPEEIEWRKVMGVMK